MFSVLSGLFFCHGQEVAEVFSQNFRHTLGIRYQNSLGLSGIGCLAAHGRPSGCRRLGRVTGPEHGGELAFFPAALFHPARYKLNKSPLQQRRGIVSCGPVFPPVLPGIPEIPFLFI